MANPLTKKLGPLPVWGWGLAGGGLIGIVILMSKGKSNPKAASESEAEAAKKLELEQLLQSLEAQAGGGAGSGGGSGDAGGGVNTPVTPEQTAATFPPLEPAYTAPVETPAPAEPAAPALASKSAVPAKVGKKPYGIRNPNIETLTGKKGPEYRNGTYKGMPAHIYDAAVKGGVGKAKNVIVLNAGKKTHAKGGQHEPASHKEKAPPHVTTRKPRAPKVVKHAATKTKAKAAPKKKIKPRAPAKHTPPKKKIKR